MAWDKEFYLIECHTSFTYSNGNIVTDIDESNAMFVKGKFYKMMVEPPGKYLTGWIKYGNISEFYGPGIRFMIEGDLNESIKNNYVDFFYTPQQTKRNEIINDILY